MNSSGAQIDRLKCRAANCVRSPAGDCICVYGVVGITGPVQVYGSVGVTGVQLNLTGPIGVTGTVGITGPVTVTGAVGVTGTVGITGPVTINGNVGITGPVTVTGVVDITSASNSDAFGRLRVSNPYTLFEFSSIAGLNTALIDTAATGAGATATHTGASYTELSVPAISGASVIRQSYEYIPYQPGKSKLIFLTGVLSPATNPTSGFTSRIGTFDDYNGIYIQATGKTLNNLSVVIRNYNEVSPVSENIAYYSGSPTWNGTLPPDFDITKAQIYYFDIEWLGVGQVRCGVVYGGKFYVYHTFTNINLLTAPYMQLAKLPLRYELRSTGSAATMRMICGTAISEGGFSPLGRVYNYNNYGIVGTSGSGGGVVVDTNNDNTKWVPVLGIRLKSPTVADPTKPFTRRGTLKIKALDIYNTVANATGAWKLILNPTISAPTTPAATWINYSVYETNSRASESLAQYIQYPSYGSPASNYVTGGITLYSGCYATRTNVELAQTTDELISAWGANANIAGIPDEIILAVNVIAPSGTDPTIFASISWIELI